MAVSHREVAETGMARKLHLEFPGARYHVFPRRSGAESVARRVKSLSETRPFPTDPDDHAVMAGVLYARFPPQRIEAILRERE